MFTEKDLVISTAIRFAIQISLYMLLAYALAAFLGTLHVGYILFLFVAIGITSMLIGFVGTTVAWLAYSRQRTIVVMLECLKANQFPMRRWKDQSFANYLSHITEEYDDEPYPDGLRRLAKEIEQTFVWSPTVGFSQGWRMLRAWESAFELYSPNTNAPRAY